MATTRPVVAHAGAQAVALAGGIRQFKVGDLAADGSTRGLCECHYLRS